MLLWVFPLKSKYLSFKFEKLFLTFKAHVDEHFKAGDFINFVINISYLCLSFKFNF